MAAQQDAVNVFEDFDGDGLSNAEELSLGTDYQNPDTDGDGFGDGVEVASGYDPLKPAPGDRIINPEETSTSGEGGRGGVEGNLTETISTDLYEYFEDAAETNTKDGISTEDLDGEVERVVNQNVSLDDLPSIDVDRIKVKNQDYANLSTTQKQEQIDNDNKSYITEVLFILKKNEPSFTKSKSDVEVRDLVISQATSYFTTLDDSSFFDNALGDASVIKNQLYNVVVPDEMFDIHVKALKLFEYAEEIGDEGAHRKAAEDPLALVVALTKVEMLMQLFQDYQESLQVYVEKYDLQALNNKIAL